MTSRIFALAKNPPPRPLAELLEQLRQFTPPNKSPELLVFAEARRVAGENQIAATKALGELLAKVREAEGKGQRYASHADIAVAERLVADCDSKLVAAREREEEACLAWRREYAKALTDAVGPARTALHDLVDEISSAMTLFRAVGNQAAQQPVGSNWILREAETIIAALQTVKDRLDLDRRVL